MLVLLIDPFWICNKILSSDLTNLQHFVVETVGGKNKQAKSISLEVKKYPTPQYLATTAFDNKAT